MTLFDKPAAESAIDALHLTRSNGELAARWLSLWQSGHLPSRTRFQPVNFKPFLSTLVLFNVVPRQSVTVRLAGTRYSHLLGREMTGMDWIAAAPESHRAVRLKIFSDIAEGAIAIDHRRLVTETDEEYIAEEIVLPFAPDADGTVTVIGHANVPVEWYLKVKSVSQAIGEPIDYAIVPLDQVDNSAQSGRDTAIIAA